MDNRETDRRIAEKVMVWTQRPHPYYKDQKKCWYKTHKHGWMWKINCDDWQPSTNIAHAFEVVEKMREKGWTFSLCNNNEACGQGDSSVEFWNDSHSMDGEFMKFADTPAMAICLAALEAVKGKDDGRI